MAVVLKTTEPETVPGVRIPLSPPTFSRFHGLPHGERRLARPFARQNLEFLYPSLSCSD